MVMRRFIVIAIAVCVASCSKNNTIPPVSGTINGVPAITLYGSSNQPADYLFLSSVATDKELSYNGRVYPYLYLTTSDTELFVMSANRALVKGSLVTTGTITVFTIDTSYTPTFGSTKYTSR